MDNFEIEIRGVNELGVAILLELVGLWELVDVLDAGEELVNKVVAGTIVVEDILVMAPEVD